MGTFIRDGDRFIYRQADGETTAWFYDYQEKSVLGHEGSPRYRKVLHFFVAAGCLYLFLVFLFY